MIHPTPTAYRGILTVHTDNREELAKLFRRLGDVTLAIASPSLARLTEAHTGPHRPCRVASSPTGSPPRRMPRESRRPPYSRL